jgi:serine phosphatase RsbU (regulator of sigma subunit)
VEALVFARKHNTMLPVEYAFAGSTMAGQTESGDRHVVVPNRAGALIGVIDGLGHGLEAAEAANVAVEMLKEHPNEALIALLRRCDEALRTTRGAVMSLAAYNNADRVLALLSVGNIECVLLHAGGQGLPDRETVLMRGGVVGLHLPMLQTLQLQVGRGDVLLFATDGIRSGFDQRVPLGAPLQEIADNICSHYCKGTDDALVLAARFPGGGNE